MPNIRSISPEPATGPARAFTFADLDGLVGPDPDKIGRIVDGTGTIVRETKVASEPDAVVALVGSLGFAVKRIGLAAQETRALLVARKQLQAKMRDI